MKHIINIIAILALCFGSIRASNGGDLLAEADSLYAGGKYVAALQLYEQAEKQVGSSAQLLYNMGNAAVHANRFGTAMVAYQRAASLAPSDARIRNNIAYLLDKVDDRNAAKLGGKKGNVARETPSAISSLWLAITSTVSPDFWGWMAFASFLLLLAGIVAYVLSANVSLRKGGFFTALVCIGITIICGIFTMGARRYWQHREACVVTAYETTPLPKPDANSESTMTPLVAGTLLSTPETADSVPAGWIFVRLNNTTSGYVPVADVTKL